AGAQREVGGGGAVGGDGGGPRGRVVDPVIGLVRAFPTFDDHAAPLPESLVHPRGWRWVAEVIGYGDEPDTVVGARCGDLTLAGRANVYTPGACVADAEVGERATHGHEGRVRPNVMDVDTDRVDHCVRWCGGQFRYWHCPVHSG